MASKKRLPAQETILPPSEHLLTRPQLEALNNAIERGLSPLRTSEPLRCSEWAREHFYLSAESSAIEGPFDPFPWQVAVLDCMGNDDIEVVTWRKCSRVGYTKCLSALTGYAHEHKRRNVLIYKPTDDHAKRFCKQTIDPMLRDVASLKHLLSASGKNNKENTLTTKHFLGSVLDVLGGKTANNYREHTKDLVIYDELDAFDSDVEGEGSPTSLGDKRVADSSFPKSIRGTTPTIFNQSLIQKSEEAADIVFRYAVSCIYCDGLQPFEWGAKDEPHGMKWDSGDPSTAHYVCKHCHETWHFGDLDALFVGARWETEDGQYINEASELCDPDGTVVEWPRHVAFTIWAAYSPLLPWPRICEEFINCADDPEALKTFTNTTLGEYWHDTILEVEAEPLYERREVYDQAPSQVKVVTIGADVQIDRIEFEVVGWGEFEESWSLHYGILSGDPTRGEVWSNFAREIRQKWPVDDGRELKARMVCVDSGYLPEQVYDFSRRNGVRFVVPVKGANIPGQPIAVFPRRPNEKRVYLTRVGTDNAKTTLYKRLLLDEPGPGFMHYPEREVYDHEFFYQLTGEEKRPHKRAGRKVLMYEQTYANVEVLDCRVYALAGIKVLQDRFGVRLNGSGLSAGPTPGPPDSTPPSTPAPTTAPPKRTQRRRRNSGGWMKR